MRKNSSTSGCSALAARYWRMKGVCWVDKTLTDQPGSSAWFAAGAVVYSYEAKEALLGVNPRTLEHTGAVSEETVLEMVSGAMARYGAGVAVAVTGIAGPSGGTQDKPVGTVWIGWKRRGGYAHAQLFHFAGDREAIRRQSVAAALSGVRKALTARRAARRRQR